MPPLQWPQSSIIPTFQCKPTPPHHSAGSCNATRFIPLDLSLKIKKTHRLHFHSIIPNTQRISHIYTPIWLQRRLRQVCTYEQSYQSLHSWPTTHRIKTLFSCILLHPKWINRDQTWHNPKMSDACQQNARAITAYCDIQVNCLKCTCTNCTLWHSSKLHVHCEIQIIATGSRKNRYRVV